MTAGEVGSKGGGGGMSIIPIKTTSLLESGSGHRGLWGAAVSSLHSRRPNEPLLFLISLYINTPLLVNLLQICWHVDCDWMENGKDRNCNLLTADRTLTGMRTGVA